MPGQKYALIVTEKSNYFLAFEYKICGFGWETGNQWKNKDTGRYHIQLSEFAFYFRMMDLGQEPIQAIFRQQLELELFLK